MPETNVKEVTTKQQRLVAKLTQITETLGIQAYDALLIGDGSGSGWNLATGWACTLIDRYSGAAKMFYGAVNSGTISLGELFPYLHALLWFFSDGPGKERAAAALANSRMLQVHIITDSAYIANCGNQVAGRNSHVPLWVAMDAFAQQGVALHYHHWGRKTLSLNILADEVARQSRYLMDTAYKQAISELARKYPGVSKEADVYDFFLYE